ncbi:HesA/MoeB/ThiF family protein [uncultured Maribacter sp.]|uniref:HesA/MoeB/ThiF family protein n=1 Tax=uncultured Maribacter sp. TaxID=431308 RepID=UPI002621EA6E|nr:HesA/MoeB/ThiF family protein [uncultured Maribacter sp.]
MSQDRYSRQLQLKDFGVSAQAKLSEAKVLVIGAGGLGVPVLTYLNAMGVGEIGIVDKDVVSITNLHRQVLYDECDVGKSKVKVAVRKLMAQNSNTKITAIDTFLEVTNAIEIIKPYDYVVDASDNFPTRYLVNDACILLNKPFVYGALHGFEGQVSVFNANGGPTYRCLFPNMPKEDEVPNCNENGVLGILPGIIGNLQALETVKLITGIGDLLSGTLLIFNGLSQRTQKIKFSLVSENSTRKKLETSYDFQCNVDLSSIEAIALQQLLEEEEIQLIDVRTENEFETEHLIGALNIPLDEIEERLKELRIVGPIYFICQSGIRSKKAISIVKTIFPEASCVNVNGGMNSLNSFANFA